MEITDEMRIDAIKFFYGKREGIPPEDITVEIVGQHPSGCNYRLKYYRPEQYVDRVVPLLDDKIFIASVYDWMMKERAEKEKHKEN